MNKFVLTGGGNREISGGKKLKNSVDYGTILAQRGEAKEIQYSPEEQNVLKNRMIEDFESEIFHKKKNFQFSILLFLDKTGRLPEVVDSFGCKPFRGK